MATNTNGSKTTISGETKVTLKTVAAVLSLVVPLVCAGTGAWFDLRAKIDSLEHTIRSGMTDRWTRTDDRAHMEVFAAANGLRHVDHHRVTQGGD